MSDTTPTRPRDDEPDAVDGGPTLDPVFDDGTGREPQSGRVDERQGEPQPELMDERDVADESEPSTVAPVGETAPEPTAGAPESAASEAAAPDPIASEPEAAPAPLVEPEVRRSTYEAPSAPDPQPDIEAPRSAGDHAAAGALGVSPASASSQSTSTAAPAYAETPARTEEPTESEGSTHVETSAHPAPSAAPHVVYVDTPRPPKRKGNRLFGVLMAILATLLFALLYAGVGTVIVQVTAPGLDPLRLLMSANFWVPVAVFLVAFVLAVLIANRASWWAHILLSLLVGLAVYFVTIAIAVLAAGGVTLTGEEARRIFLEFSQDPLVIGAGLVAREVAIWVGLGISARGRRVKARNVEAREAFDREQAEARAERERASSAA